MAILGPRALIDIAVPTGVDATEVLRIQMENGMSAQEVIGLAATVIGQANEYVMQRYGGLLVLTERYYARYRQGETSRSMTPVKAEFATADPVRTAKIGHMLPRTDYEDAIGWSAEFLRRANVEDMQDDADLIQERWMNRLDYEIVWRQLMNTEVQVGDAGYSVPWAVGTGANVNYIPPQWRANIFDSTHTHFYRLNGALNAANALTTIEAMSAHLSHHGLTGRKVCIVSESDISTYEGMDSTKFVTWMPREFEAMAGATDRTIFMGEVEGIPGETFGYVRTRKGVVEMVYHERYPTGYLHMTKSFGINNRQNGLAIRTEPGVGFGLRVDPQVSKSITPQLEKINFPATHGVGVNDRLNGVSAQIEAGAATYSNPTIS